MQLELQGAGLRGGGAGGSGRTILQPLALRMAAGEQLAVVGPSGAGKTSLLHLIAGARRPDSGHVLLDGQDPWALTGAQRHHLRARVFLAPQQPPLPPRQRVVTAVLAGRLPAMGFWRSLASLFYPLEIPAAFEALCAFGLESRLFDRVDRLSGGERQRVSLARALVAPARLWLLDEPLSALDPVLAGQVIGVLREEAARRGITLLCSLHQIDLARQHFPRLVGLRAGAVVFDESAASLQQEQVDALYAAGAPAPATPGEPGTAGPDLPAPPVALHCR